MKLFLKSLWEIAVSQTFFGWMGLLFIVVSLLPIGTELEKLAGIVLTWICLGTDAILKEIRKKGEGSDS